MNSILDIFRDPDNERPQPWDGLTNAEILARTTFTSTPSWRNPEVQDTLDMLEQHRPTEAVAVDWDSLAAERNLGSAALDEELPFTD